MPRGLALQTTLGVTTLMPVLVTWTKYLMEAIEATCLVHGLYVDESSAYFV